MSRLSGRRLIGIQDSWPAPQRNETTGLSKGADRGSPLTLGGDPSKHHDVATNLENYTALLRKIRRACEAIANEARAKVIRAKRVG
jgi:hypothetical protein